MLDAAVKTPLADTTRFTCDTFGPAIYSVQQVATAKIRSANRSLTLTADFIQAVFRVSHSVI